MDRPLDALQPLREPAESMELQGLRDALLLEDSAPVTDRSHHHFATDRPTVLLVDDEEHVVESLRDALHGMPFRVRVATSGFDAIEIVESEEIDVVISDQKMPGMTGTELLSRVRRSRPETIRILLTGHATLETAVQAINEGQIYRFLAKPCTRPKIAQAITEGIRLRKTVRSSRQALLAAAANGDRILQLLEQEHPGITHLIEDARGALVVPEEAETGEQVLQNLEERMTGGR